MAALMATCLATLKTGDHVVCAANVFGATVQLFSTVLARFGIETTYVKATDPAAWRAAATPRTRLMFCESPSNPLAEIVDLAAFAALGREIGALTVVDNCFCTPVAQRPLEFGVDAVMHSATKYLDGQGRVVGGAVLGSKALIRDQVLPVLRTTGPSLSAFNAWVLLKGLETLAVRLRAQSATAQQLAEWLERQPGVARVYFPGLASHPQAALVARQQTLPGAVLAFELGGASPEEQRARLAPDRRHAGHVDHRKPRRHAHDDHASGDDDARAPFQRGARARRHHRGPRAHRRRPRIDRGPEGGPVARSRRVGRSDGQRAPRRRALRRKADRKSRSPSTQSVP
jgi:O-succinylhomoserine sulfhydrylase